MVYQWDRDKANANLRKHGIDFADAVSVFSDNLAITIPDDRFDEERLITIGLDSFGRVLGSVLNPPASYIKPLRLRMKIQP